MKLKTILLLAVAVGCGLVAMLGVQQSMNGRSRAEAEPKVSVLMAVTDIAVGQVLTPDNVTFRDVDMDTAPANAVLKEEEYKNRSATVAILANDFITLPKLSEPGISGPSVAIPPGMRVVTVPVNDTTSHSGMMAPGDRVDVLVTYQSRTQRGQTTQTKVLLEFIEVFATGNKTVSDGRGEGEQKIKNVSLLVTPEQMPYVKLAEKKGTLSLSWRRKDDDEIVKVAAVDEELMHELQGTLDKDHRGYTSYNPLNLDDGESSGSSNQGLRSWIDEQREAMAAAEAKAAAEAAAKAEQEAALLAAAKAGKPIWKMEIFHGEKRSLVELELPEDANAVPATQGTTTGEGKPAGLPAPAGIEPVSTEAEVKAMDWKSLLKGLTTGT
jgi:pilus assembly protein CpaB